MTVEGGQKFFFRGMKITSLSRFIDCGQHANLQLATNLWPEIRKNKKGTKNFGNFFSEVMKDTKKIPEVFEK